MQRDVQFGSWLRACRKALDLTQAELASQIGCAVITVKKIETTTQRPSKQLAERLARVLSIAPSEQAAFVAFARGVSATPPAALALKTEARLADHLPSPPTPFVGRSQEMTLLRQRLDGPDCRLLTLVGPGGIGKTRLAVEAAHTQRTNFAHGVHFVSLALVNSPDAVLFAVGTVLEFSFDGQQAPLGQLIDYIRDKMLLLVLDGFEHLLDAVPLLANLLAGAPHLKLLVTSRERLNLQGEWALPIEAMEYPQGTDHDHVQHYSAIQLFVQTARQAQPGFSLTSNVPGVVHICQLVEGIPLAIELAAAWVRLLPCAHIAERLASSLDFLASPGRSAPERHRSLRAVFDHSWALLSSAEQTALARLSVFRGSFDLAAAEAVGGASLLMVASLADKSLLRVHGAGRYAVHELLRQYASEQLTRQADWVDHRERTIDYLVQAAAHASGAAAHRQASALLGQAIAIAEELGQSDVLGELHHRRAQALLKVSLWLEARPDLEAARIATGIDRVDRQVQILLDLADVSFYLHDPTGQRRCVEEALELAGTAARGDLAAAVMVKQGYVETNDGNLEEAVGLYERAISLGGDAHYDLGRTLYWNGRYRDALPHLRQAVASNQNDPINQIWPLEDLGLVLSATGQYAEAARVYDEAQRLSREHEVWPALARCVANLAGMHLDVFDYSGNEALAQEARELARAADFVLTEVSAGLDLLLNFARRHEAGRAEQLMVEVATAVEKAGGSHGWLWRLRLVQAQAELACARQDWGRALRTAEMSIRESRDRGRVKYETLGLKTRAQALAALGRTHEATRDLRNALEIARPTGDPALLVSVAASLLVIEGDEALADDARSAAERIRAALPTPEMRRSFDAAEPVRAIATFGG